MKNNKYKHPKAKYISYLKNDITIPFTTIGNYHPYATGSEGFLKSIPDNPTPAGYTWHSTLITPDMEYTGIYG